MVDPGGRGALSVMGGGTMLNWGHLVSIEKFDKGGRHFFFALTRRIELTVPVTAKVCRVIYAREVCV